MDAWTWPKDNNSHCALVNTLKRKSKDANGNKEEGTHRQHTTTKEEDTSSR